MTIFTINSTGRLHNIKAKIIRFALMSIDLERSIWCALFLWFVFLCRDDESKKPLDLTYFIIELNWFLEKGRKKMRIWDFLVQNKKNRCRCWVTFVSRWVKILIRQSYGVLKEYFVLIFLEPESLFVTICAKIIWIIQVKYFSLLKYICWTMEYFRNITLKFANKMNENSQKLRVHS